MGRFYYEAASHGIIPLLACRPFEIVIGEHLNPDHSNLFSGDQSKTFTHGILVAR